MQLFFTQNLKIHFSYKYLSKYAIYIKSLYNIHTNFILSFKNILKYYKYIKKYFKYNILYKYII